MGQTNSRATCEIDVEKCMDIAKGSFQVDPDVAGLGVLHAFAVGAFVAITLSLISALMQLFQISNLFGILSRRRRDELGRKAVWRNKNKELSHMEKLLQDLVMSLSDQQIVLGLAFSVAIRYYLGCAVSAYHYDIIANLILITMTTHVCAIMVLPKYFSAWPLAFLRTVAISFIVVWSGLLFVNQDTLNHFPVAFPTAIPNQRPTEGDMFSLALFFPAACYQSEGTRLAGTLENTFKTVDNFRASLVDSSASRRFVHGYSQWIILTLLYIVAFIVNAVQFFLRKKDSKWARYGKKLVWLFKFLAIAAGYCVSIWSYIYIWRLRNWVDDSGWVQVNDNGENPENYWFSFGQLVPVFLLALVPAQALESWFDWHKGNKMKAAAVLQAQEGGSTVFPNKQEQQEQPSPGPGIYYNSEIQTAQNQQPLLPIHAPNYPHYQ